MTKYEVYQVQIFYCLDCLEKNHTLVYHEDSTSYCPVCGAAPERQDFALKDEYGDGVEDVDSDHPLALEMLYQSRMRLFKRAIFNAPLSTLSDMMVELMETIGFKRDEHPEPQGVRAGLFEDKINLLQEIKKSLLINNNPEENIQLEDGPIY